MKNDMIKEVTLTVEQIEALFRRHKKYEDNESKDKMIAAYMCIHDLGLTDVFEVWDAVNVLEEA